MKKSNEFHFSPSVRFVHCRQRSRRRRRMRAQQKRNDQFRGKKKNKNQKIKYTKRNVKIMNTAHGDVRYSALQCATDDDDDDAGRNHVFNSFNEQRLNYVAGGLLGYY